jgi:hypothetical protein
VAENVHTAQLIGLRECGSVEILSTPGQSCNWGDHGSMVIEREGMGGIPAECQVFPVEKINMGSED